MTPSTRPNWRRRRSWPATRDARSTPTATNLRASFQWAADERLDVLKATRPQIDLYVRAMEARGLAATTIDRRLSTVCGFYRFAHIDDRIASNPAQYVRRPKVHPNDARGLDRAELGGSCSWPSGSTTPTPHWPCSWASNGLRVCEACSADIDNLGFERGHRILRIVGKGNKPAVIPLVPRTARTIDLAIGERTSGPILLRHDGSRLDRRPAHRVAMSEEVSSEAPLLDEWRAEVGDDAVAAAVEAARAQIADGSLRGFFNKDELLDYLQRSHRRTA